MKETISSPDKDTPVSPITLAQVMEKQAKSNAQKEKSKPDLSFTPYYVQFFDYIVIGDKVAVEFLKRCEDKTNISSCSRLSDLFCNEKNDSAKSLANIDQLPKNITKAIIMLGHDEHIESNFHVDKYINNLSRIVKKLKERRAFSIILGKLIPKPKLTTELQYWTMVNEINFKIHEFSTDHKIQYANLDQAMIEMDRERSYTAGSFYFDRTGQIRFKVLTRNFNDDGYPSDYAYKAIYSKLVYVINEMEKQQVALVTASEQTKRVIVEVQHPEPMESEADEEFDEARNTPHTVNLAYNKKEEESNPLDLEYEVEIPKDKRPYPIVSTTAIPGDDSNREAKEFRDADWEREVVTVRVPAYVKAPYILFEFNGYILPALLDTGSAYNFIAEELFNLVSAKADPKKIREVASAQINISGVIGKKTAKVTRNVYSTIGMLDDGLKRVDVWTTFRIIKGFNTPVIISREFLTVYAAKVGFGERLGCSFLQPPLKEKVRLRVYNSEQIRALVKTGVIQDPHCILQNTRISTIHVATTIQKYVGPEQYSDTTVGVIITDITDCPSDDEEQFMQPCNTVSPVIRNEDDYEVTKEEYAIRLKYENRLEDASYPEIMNALVEEHRKHLFSGNHGMSLIYQHHFNIDPAYKPTMCKHYELPLKVQAEAKIIIERWLKQGIIAHTNSGYRNPLVAVKKKDGTIRLFGDYRMPQATASEVLSIKLMITITLMWILNGVEITHSC
ncbi:hypothetical protein ACFE04_008647 [Oxalis oulophora]